MPQHFDAGPLHALVRRRHAELAAAIDRRQWFDPWVFELEPVEAAADAGGELDAAAAAAREAVYPWVAGFATAMELFPALMRIDSPTLLEPLALIYRHLGPDDLLALVETLEAPADLAQAVEELVRATLLLADLSRARPPGPRAPSTRR